MGRRFKIVKLSGVTRLSLPDLVVISTGVRKACPTDMVFLIEIRRYFKDGSMSFDFEDALTVVLESDSFDEVPDGQMPPELAITLDYPMYQRATSFLAGTPTPITSTEIVQNKINNMPRPSCNCEMEYLVGGARIHSKHCASLTKE